MWKSKAELRTHMKALQALMEEKAREEERRLVAERLFALGAFQEAKTILVYLALKSELDTAPILARCFQEKKRVYVPVMRNGRMFAARLKEDAQLAVGEMGVFVPTEQEETAEAFDLAVVPGLAFSKTGQRLGRGGGVFDRFLAGKQMKKAGVCFSHQLVEDLPFEEPHDERMDMVLAPNATICL